MDYAFTLFKKKKKKRFVGVVIIPFNLTPVNIGRLNNWLIIITYYYVIITFWIKPIQNKESLFVFIKENPC